MKEILEGNGIRLRRHNEDRELAQMLEINGYVDIFGGLGEGINVRLTTEGAMFVENNSKPVKEDYEDIRRPPKNLSRSLTKFLKSWSCLAMDKRLFLTNCKN